MKFISWNVNGLRACVTKGFKESFEAIDADFFCLQETKMQAGQLDIAFDGYESYWNYAEKKGYSGTAIFTKHQPLNVTYGLGIEEHDHEGRVITLEMENFYLVTCYTLTRKTDSNAWNIVCVGKTISNLHQAFRREKACNSMWRLERCSRRN